MRIDLINKANGTDRDYYLLIIDMDGVIYFANSHLISNLGLKQDKLTACTFIDLLEQKHQKHFRDTLSYVQKTNNSASIEAAVCNGSMHWIKWEISLYQNKTGSTGKFLCVGWL